MGSKGCHSRTLHGHWHVSKRLSLTGHFYLTKLLLPTLIDDAAGTPTAVVRTVASSSSHPIAHTLGYARLNADMDREKEVEIFTYTEQTCQLFALRVDVFIGRDLLAWEYPCLERAFMPRQQQKHHYHCDFSASRKRQLEP